MQKIASSTPGWFALKCFLASHPTDFLSSGGLRSASCLSAEDSLAPTDHGNLVDDDDTLPEPRAASQTVNAALPEAPVVHKRFIDRPTSLQALQPCNVLLVPASSMSLPVSTFNGDATISFSLCNGTRLHLLLLSEPPLPSRPGSSPSDPSPQNLRHIRRHPRSAWARSLEYRTSLKSHTHGYNNLVLPQVQALQLPWSPSSDAIPGGL